MMRVALSFPLLCILCGCLTDFGDGPSGPNGMMADAEYVVLNAIVAPLFSHPSDSVIVLVDSTRSGIYSYDLENKLNDLLLRLSQDVPSLEASTIQDFKTKNFPPTLIDAPARIHPNCVRFSSTTKRFPSLQVSRVGFSLDRQQALVYIGYMPAPLAGYGFYSVLSRQSGAWTVIATRTAWIS